MIGESQEDLDQLGLLRDWHRYGDVAQFYSTEPVEADPVSAEALRAAYGPRLAFLDQMWLLWVAVERVDTPLSMVTAPDPACFARMGPVDRVVCEGFDVIRVSEARPWSSIWPDILWPIVGGDLRMRYLTVLADRYDERGMRIERVVGRRCTTEPLDLSEDRLTVVLRARAGRDWWADL